MNRSDEALAKKQAEYSKRVMASRIINDALGGPIEYGQEVAASLSMEEIEIILQLGNSPIAAVVISKLILLRRSLNSAQRLTEAAGAFVGSIEVAEMEEETNQRRLAIQDQLKSLKFDTQELPGGKTPIGKPRIYQPEDGS